MRCPFALAVLPAALLAACQPSTPAAPQDPFEGAWQISEISFTSPDTSYVITNPQPSLYLFIAGHYSTMYVPTAEPRPLVAGDTPIIGAIEPTDAEKVASWDTFIANSGTYETTESTITTRPIVAKSANLMASGGPLTMSYHAMEGMLHLTFVRPWAPETESLITLVRIQ
jgi:hypothetical protein